MIYMSFQKHLCILNFFNIENVHHKNILKQTFNSETLKTHFYKQHATRKNTNIIYNI